MSGHSAGSGSSSTGRSRAWLVAALLLACAAGGPLVGLAFLGDLAALGGYTMAAAESPGIPGDPAVPSGQAAANDPSKGSGSAAASVGNPEITEARVVVTTTLIGAAVADVAGDWCGVDVLIPPAGCPGHFDIGPQALAALQGAALIMRHDYQQHLEARLREGQDSADRFVSLSTTGSQTLPGPYLDLCAQVARALELKFPQRETELDQSLDSLQSRIDAVSAKSQARSQAVLRGMPLLAAEFQADLVKWAGAMAPVTYERGEDMSLSRMQTVLRKADEAGVQGVVGNLQWGDREVRSFSEELGVPGVTLSNYPLAAEAGAWEQLMRVNLELLFSLVEDD